MLEKLPESLGHALSDLRAGLDKTMHVEADLRQGKGAILIASLAFADHAPLPARYTADGAGVSPPLHWSGVPAGTAELVLVVEDADSPTPQPLVHAIVTGLAGDEEGALAEGAFGAGSEEGSGDDAPRSGTPLAMGRNSLLSEAWLAPDPPPGHGVHRYAFQLFALAPAASVDETLAAGAGRDAVRVAVAARALASGCLIGTCERSGTIAQGTNKAAPVVNPAAGFDAG